jgi:hypothetical protein
MTFGIYFSHFKLFKVEWGKEQKKLKVRYYVYKCENKFLQNVMIHLTQIL